MLSKWVSFFCFCLVLGGWNGAFAEAVSSDYSQGTASPEQVHIFSISGKAMANHPPVINVLPGEQISFSADVLQFGNACPHPEGCPEGRTAEEFSWSADDRADDNCSARRPDLCRDRTGFQPEGTEMIFHIPYAMNHDITVRVTHESLTSQDGIVLHNAHDLGLVRSTNYPAPPTGYYDNSYYDTHLYPTIAPSGINQPYYPYPYDYHWVAWGWYGPGWSVAMVGPGWGWGWGYPYGGWRGGYYGVYGYHSPGWWHPGYVGVVAGPRIWGSQAAPRMVERVNRLPSRPVGYGGEYRGGNFGGAGGRRGGFRRGGWR